MGRCLWSLPYNKQIGHETLALSAFLAFRRPQGKATHSVTVRLLLGWNGSKAATEVDYLHLTFPAA